MCCNNYREKYTADRQKKVQEISEKKENVAKILWNEIVYIF